jgi:hypothetical protein
MGCGVLSVFTDVTSLFYMGYRFYGLPREFLFHMTHPKSESRLAWDKGRRFEVRYSEAKVANRIIGVWHGATEHWPLNEGKKSQTFAARL